MEVLEQKMTYANLMEIPEGDTGIYELLNGEIVRRSSPNTPHQRTLLKLVRYFDRFNEEKNLGQLFFAPYDVYLDEYNAGIQPDLLFVSHERDFIIKENNGVVGAPDLAIEILSKGTTNRDRGIKKDIYEQFAVWEYWIVDTQNRSIEVYRMENNRYRLFSFAEEEGVVKSSVLEGLELEVGTIFGKLEISNIKQVISNVQVSVAFGIRRCPKSKSHREWANAALTWTLKIPCWILDIPYSLFSANPSRFCFHSRIPLPRFHPIIPKTITDAHTHTAAVPATAAKGIQAIEIGIAIPACFIENIVGAEAHIQPFAQEFALQAKI